LGSEGTSQGKKDLHGNTKHCTVPLAQQSISPACPFLKELPKSGAVKKSSGRNQSVLQGRKYKSNKLVQHLAQDTRILTLSFFTALLHLSLN